MLLYLFQTEKTSHTFHCRNLTNLPLDMLDCREHQNLIVEKLVIYDTSVEPFDLAAMKTLLRLEKLNTLVVKSSSIQTLVLCSDDDSPCQNDWATLESLDLRNITLLTVKAQPLPSLRQLLVSGKSGFSLCIGML